MKSEKTNRPESLKEALQQTGRPATPEFADVPEDLRDYFKSQYEAIVVVEALNKKERLSYDDPQQKKWLPWMYMGSSGFAFGDAGYDCSSADAGDASRLCCKTQADAEHFGRKFSTIIDGILRK